HDARANGHSDWKTLGKAVALGVAGTTVGGGVLAAIRRRTGHILAPVALHIAANAFGLLAVRLAHSRR
nr:CPBP family intramembrane metalloprotease [Acidimicrobiia bacterium]